MKFPCIVLIMFVSSCVEIVESDVNTKYGLLDLEPRVLFVKNILVRYPYRIMKRDNCFYILDLHGDNFFCYNIDMSKNESSMPFASKGIGPSNFLGVESFRFDNEGNILLLDANKGRIVLKDFKNRKKIEVIELPSELIRTLDFDVINDSVLVVPDYTGKHRYSLINMKGEVVKHSFKIPTRYKNQKTSGIPLAQAWRSFIDYNPKNGILVMATQLGHVLEIYDLKKDSIVSIVYGKHGEPVFVDKGAYSIPNGIMGYGDVQVTETRIYALFWGRRLKDVRENPGSSEGGNRIEVYDLAGKLLSEYLLECYVTGFFVDEDEGKIWALDINSDNPIVEFVINEGIESNK